MHSTWRKLLNLHEGSHLRRIFIRSEPSISSLGCGGPKVDGVESYFVDLEASSTSRLLRWLSSGLFIVGSGLGLCHWTESSARYGSVLVAYADEGVSGDSSEVQEAVPVKKPTFLFKGMYKL